jgi:hypothetical protein
MPYSTEGRMACYAISCKIELRLIWRAHFDPEQEGKSFPSTWRYLLSYTSILQPLSSKREVHPGALDR